MFSPIPDNCNCGDRNGGGPVFTTPTLTVVDNLTYTKHNLRQRHIEKTNFSVWRHRVEQVVWVIIITNLNALLASVAEDGRVGIFCLHLSPYRRIMFDDFKNMEKTSLTNMLNCLWGQNKTKTNTLFKYNLRRGIDR